MSVDDKCPQWIRMSTHDMESPTGSYVLGGKSEKEWAAYGREKGLEQLCARTPDGYIDVSDERRLKSLAYSLAMTPAACKKWLSVLVDGGVIDRESYESCGWVLVVDVYNSVQSYQTRVRANKRNGSKGGRPTKTQT